MCGSFTKKKNTTFGWCEMEAGYFCDLIKDQLHDDGMDGTVVIVE
jgi:hypothetical protein